MLPFLERSPSLRAHYAPETDRERRAREFSHERMRTTPGYNDYANQRIQDMKTDYLANAGIPLVSDAAGLALDADMYANNPESRTLGNFAMSGLGLLPFVPGAVGMTKDLGETIKGYHGTNAAPFDEFRTGNAQGWGEGVYFSDNPSQWKEFGNRLVEADVTLKKPFKGDWNSIYNDIEKTDAYKKRNAISNERYGEDFDIDGAIDEDGDFVNAVLRELGFDGVIVPNSNNITGKEIVAFDPAGIKIR